MVDPSHPWWKHGTHLLGSEAGWCGRLVLWTAEAKSLEWRKIGEVARFPTPLGNRNDITYGWMAPVGGGEWLVTFYCGQVAGPSDIYGLRLRLPPAG